MAKAEKTTIVVQKPVTEMRYVLTLSEEEAVALHSLVGACSSYNSDFETYGLYRALHDALGGPDTKYDLYDEDKDYRIDSIKLKEING